MAKKTVTDEQLLSWFDGMYADDEGVSQYSAKVVRTRVAHNCPGNFKEALHDAPAGSRMVVEKAIVDDDGWKTCYTCEDCVIAWAKQTGEFESGGH